MRSFLIIGGYSCRNPGDEAILKSTVYQILGIFPEAKFYILADNKDFNITFDRKVNFDMVYWIPIARYFKGDFLQKLIGKIYSMFFPFPRMISSLFRDKGLKQIMVTANDVLIIGGGYINSLYSILEINYLVELLKKNNKRFFLLGQTLGPFKNNLHKRMAKEILDASSKIVLREKGSLVEVNDYIQKTIVSSDAAILFEPILNQMKIQNIDQYLGDHGTKSLQIGINLINWEDARAYYPIIARQLEDVVRLRPDVKILFLFVPMESSKFCDDRTEGTLLKEFLGPNISFIIVKEDISVEEKQLLINKMDLFVGMRFHSIVFALSAAVPSIAVYKGEYYWRKMIGVLDVFGLDNALLSLDEVEKLSKKVIEMIDDRENIKSQLMRKKKDIVADQDKILRELLLEEHSGAH